MIKGEYDYSYQPYGSYLWIGNDKTWRKGIFRSHHGIVAIDQWARYRRESAAMEPKLIGWVVHMDFIWEGRKHTTRLEREEFFTDRSMSVQASKMVSRIVHNK